MLDDLKYIHQRDVSDALGVAEKQPAQLLHDFGKQSIKITGCQNVVLAGMGGSALPGVFLQSWPGLSVPFEIVRGYSLPSYVGPKTLFISSSYSGNTEETLEALTEAEAKKATIVVIAAGGKLAARAKTQKYPLLEIPSGIQPRMASYYFWVALVQLLEPLGLVPKGSSNELQKTSAWLATELSSWRADVPVVKNQAKQLAQELMGRSVIIYSGPKLWPAANNWKICINENAKNLAWANQYPEFNHNEFISWSSHPTQKPFAVVEIRSNLEHKRVQKRFKVTERLLSGLRPAPEVIEPHGKTLLEQLLWSIELGYFTSIYLALLNGIDPTPVDLVERFKKVLDE